RRCIEANPHEASAVTVERRVRRSVRHAAIGRRCAADALARVRAAEVAEGATAGAAGVGEAAQVEAGLTFPARAAPGLVGAGEGLLRRATTGHPHGSDDRGEPGCHGPAFYCRGTRFRLSLSWANARTVTVVTPAQPPGRFLGQSEKLGKYEVIRQIAVGGMA